MRRGMMTRERFGETLSVKIAAYACARVIEDSVALLVKLLAAAFSFHASAAPA